MAAAPIIAPVALEIKNPSGPHLTLLPHQVVHFQKMCKIIEHGPICLDTSSMGLGKSFITMALALHYRFPLFVLCPKAMVSSWRQMTEFYRIPVIEIMTFPKFRGVRTPTHPYLNKEGKEYQITEKFKNLVAQGMLLVLDEIQLIKNITNTTRAARAVCHYINNNSSLTRCVCLSGSPFDKEAHVINFLRTIGFIQHKKLSHSDGAGELILLGAQELINVCARFDYATTRDIVQKEALNSDKVSKLCYQLFVGVVKKYISSAMNQKMGFRTHAGVPLSHDLKNGYYNLGTNLQEQELRVAVQALSQATRYNEKEDRVDISQEEKGFGGVIIALQRIETAKISLLTRLIRTQLTEIKTCKVIVFVSYIASIKALSAALKDFHPMEYYGECSIKEREQMTEKFQSAEQKDARLLICNLTVGSLGINLHDTKGDAPRYVYIIPNHRIQELYQCTGRAWRYGVQSNVFTRMVYGKCGMLETSILNALGRKSAVMRDVLYEEAIQDIKLPGELPNETEKDEKSIN